jgi:hypothetical protein
MILFREEIALAMELRTEGCTWKSIGYGLGVSAAAIEESVRRAKRNGRQPRPPVLAPKSRSDDLQTDHAGGEGGDVDAGTAPVSGVGKAVGDDAFR